METTYLNMDARYVTVFRRVEEQASGGDRVCVTRRSQTASCAAPAGPESGGPGGLPPSVGQPGGTEGAPFPVRLRPGGGACPEAPVERAGGTCAGPVRHRGHSVSDGGCAAVLPVRAPKYGTRERRRHLPAAFFLVFMLRGRDGTFPGWRCHPGCAAGPCSRPARA